MSAARPLPEPGARLEETASESFDAASIAAYAAVSGDDNPLHLDAALAARAGFAAPLVHGMLVMAAFEPALRAWRGDLRIAKLSGKFVQPLLQGQQARISGRVVRREGEVGVLSAVMATPLVMVLTELVANALEHGFAEGASGTVVIAASRTAAQLEVEVRDDGRGLPESFSLERATGLGLQIVRTLVDSELAGELRILPGEEAGTRAVLRVPLQHRGGR